MGKFVISAVKSGGFKFNLKAGNGEVIATSQVYKTLATCKKGIASVQKNAPVAPVEDQTVEGFAVEKNPKFEIYKDKKGEFRFRLKAANAQIIATGEGYTTIKACKNGVASIKKNAPDAKIVSE
ncbi:MAG: YegP family protein [Eubacterium sp.]|nr:YegP family protein [Eubacterium sp.]